ncbi:MAG TPA: hypothetical protein VFN74_24875 [Chloroflexota bacterium]|jgi:hypothetical protein|nr:hypothetical protein [Chloroflexota bacterium]
MGFLNLSAWRPVGGKVLAERRARTGFAQPPKYYYDHLREFQALIDRFFEEHGRRPQDVAELYLWQLDQEGVGDDEAGETKARELASNFCYYDIEPNSLLAMVAIRPDHDRVAAELLEARRTKRQQGHRPPRRIPMEAGLA